MRILLKGRQITKKQQNKLSYTETFWKTNEQ